MAEPEHEPTRLHFANNGAYQIAAERRRQYDEEGYDEYRDSGYIKSELVAAARCYLLAGAVPGTPPPGGWPWPADTWKPSHDRRRNLVKAGALIAAELDRLHYAGYKPERADK